MSNLRVRSRRSPTGVGWLIPNVTVGSVVRGFSLETVVALIDRLPDHDCEAIELERRAAAIATEANKITPSVSSWNSSGSLHSFGFTLWLLFSTLIF